MGIINIRIGDDDRDELKRLADEEGLTLSEYSRRILLEATSPVREDPSKSGAMAPSTMSLFERQTLSLLHKVLGNTLPADSNGPDGDKKHQEQLASILESGYTEEYGLESAGVRTELSIRDCGLVKDILDMYSEILHSIEHHQKQSEELDGDLQFRLEFKGFDHNDALESHMAEYVDFLIGQGRWAALKPQIDNADGGNSHSRVLGMYMRMLNEYRLIKDARRRGYDRDYAALSIGELKRLAEAQIHPSNRKAQP